MKLTKDQLLRILASGWYWVVLPMITGLLTVLLVFRLGGYADLNSVKTKTTSSRYEKSNLQKQKQNPNYDISGYLLADSILSIIYNHYVDAERVEYDDLGKIIVESLKEKTQYVVRESKNKLILTNKKLNNKSEIQIPNDMDYQDLLSFINEVATYINKQKEVVILNSTTKVTVGYLDTLTFLLGGLDAHSNLLSKESYQELRSGTRGAFGGLGMIVGIKDDLLSVIKPIPGSPAFHGGIKPGDQILSVNSHETFGEGLDQLIEHMRGEPGTKVTLGVLRKGEESPWKFDLQREHISVESTEHEVVETKSGRLLKIKVDSFSTRTTLEMASILSKYKDEPISGIVLDLRSNPGGLLDQAISVSDLFIDKGVIVSTKGREVEYEEANPYVQPIKAPLFVLINKDSASASEIVAGALQDHKKAIVIGQPSYGKGSVQTVFELPEGRALKLTISRYYTPSGRSIQNRGISPDIWLESVFAQDDNRNIFGSFRYKREKHLFNSLRRKTVEYQSSENSVKVYYMNDTKDAPYESENKLIHQIISVLVEDGVEDFKKNLKLNKIIQNASHKVKQYMNSRNVEWDVEDKTHLANSEGLEFSAHFDDQPKVSFGDQVAVNWKLKNISNKSIERVSIFINSSEYFINTHETAVGKIDANSELKGKFFYKLRRGYSNRQLTLNSGVAIDGKEVDSLSRSHSIKVYPSHQKIRLDSILQSESLKDDGVLEPTETGTLRVFIENLGTRKIKNLKVKLHLMGGSQFSLSKDTFSLKAVALKKEKYFDIQIQASESIYEKEMQLGVVVDGDNMESKQYDLFMIQAKPNRRLERVSKLAH